MSAWEIRELDEYARARHVELVPTLQSLGHMHQILKYPRYRKLAESERKWSVSPSLEETYELLDDLYSEYLGNFRSPWLNANCDEPVDLGKGLSKERAEKEGVAAIFASHVGRVQELAAKHGKKTMIWADFLFEHREVLPLLPKGLLAIDWWYEANHDFERVKILRENGIPFMAAAGTSGWNTLFPRLENALANIRGYAEAGEAPRRRGDARDRVGGWRTREPSGKLDLRLRLRSPGGLGSYRPGEESVRPGILDAPVLRPFGGRGSSLPGPRESPRDGLRSLQPLAAEDPVLRRPHRGQVHVEGEAAPSSRGLSSASVGWRRVSRRRGESSSRGPPSSRSSATRSKHRSSRRRKGSRGSSFCGRARTRRRRERRWSPSSEESRQSQKRLKRELRRLWLARNRPDGFEKMDAQYDASIRGLRRAAEEIGYGSRRGFRRR